jgi:hypothetical protein
MKAYSAGPDNASRSTAKRRAFFAVQNVAFDVVDGARSRRRGPIR